MKFFIISWNFFNGRYKNKMGVFTSKDIDEVQLEYLLESSGIKRHVRLGDDVVPNYIIEHKKLSDAFHYNVFEYMYITSDDNAELSEMLSNFTGDLKVVKYDLSNKKVFV